MSRTNGKPCWSRPWRHSSHCGSCAALLLLKDYRPTYATAIDAFSAEIPSFEGARKSLSGDCLFAYEVHGNDLTCKVTRWLLNNTDLLIYFIDEAGISHTIKSTTDAAQVKKLSNKGYNFFATQKGSTFIAYSPDAPHKRRVVIVSVMHV